MKVSIARRDLAAALKRVTPAVPKTAHLPVLFGVRLDAGAGLDLQCTSLDLTIDHCTDATVTTRGTVVVPAVLLSRLVSSLGGDTINIETDDDQLVITSGDTIAKINTLDVAAWPKIDEVDGDPIKLDADAVNAVRQVVYAASRDESKARLCAVAFNRGHAVATDGYQAAAAAIELPDDVDAIVPTLTMRAALDITGADAAVTIADNTMAWCSGSTTVRARLVAEEYVAWPNVFRTKSPINITVPLDALTASLKRVSSVSGDDVGTAGAVVMTFDAAANTLTLERRSKGDGVVTDVVPVQGTFEADAKVLLNGTFLAESLANLDEADDTITFGVIDGMKYVQWSSGLVTHILVPINPNSVKR